MPVIKTCCVCRANVANQKRVKDTEGRYYCHPCWNAKVGAAHVHANSESISAGDDITLDDLAQLAAHVHAGAEGISADNDITLDDLVQLEASGTPSPSQGDSLACSVCQGQFPYNEIQNHEGRPVCMGCMWKVATPAPAEEGVGSDGMKECPYCAERIQARAKKCRYCGESVIEDGTIPLGTASRLVPAVAQSSQPMLSVGAVQTSLDSVTLSQPLQVAFRSVVHAISNIGEVREQNVAKGLVSGVVKYGLNNIKVKASLKALGTSTKVTVETGRGDAFGYSRKVVTRRIVEMLCNLDNPQYRPKRDDKGLLDGISVGVGFRW